MVKRYDYLTINKSLESNVVMYLLHKDVKTKLIYNRTTRITVLWLMMQIYCDVLEMGTTQSSIEYRFYLENIFYLFQFYFSYIALLYRFTLVILIFL